MERHIFHELVTCHYHSRHPEEQDVRTSHKIIGRIIIRKIPVRDMLRMSRHLRIENGYRPQPRREPRIQHILILLQICGRNVRIELSCLFQSLFRCRSHDIPSIREIVCRYLLSPPQLAGNAPVVYILHPVTVSVAVFVRNQPDAAALH